MRENDPNAPITRLELQQIIGQQRLMMFEIMTLLLEVRFSRASQPDEDKMNSAFKEFIRVANENRDTLAALTSRTSDER